MEFFYADFLDKEMMKCILSAFAQKLKIIYCIYLHDYLDELEHFPNLTELYLPFTTLNSGKFIPFHDNI